MSNLTFCRVCEESIVKGSKFCKECGAEQKKKKGFLSECLVVLSTIFGCYFLFAMCSNFIYDTPKSAKEFVFNKNQLNVRSGSSTDFEVVHIAKPGTKMEVIETANSWIKIKLGGGFLEEETIGWVNSSYTSGMNEYGTWRDQIERNAWKTRDSKVSAYIMCEDWIEQRLKTPATAEFQGVLSGRYDRVIQTNQRYSIRSYVDSQNGFGAMIRSDFHCVTTQTSDGEWELNRLDIE